MAIPAWAAQGPKPEPPASTSTAAGAPPAVGRSTSSLTQEDILARFQALDRSLESLSARFEQRLDMPGSGVSRQVEGTLRYRRPSALRLEHTAPERQTVVSDGRWIWIHRHSTNQAIQANFNEWKKSDTLAQSLLEFGKFSDTLRKYEVSVDTTPAPDLAARATAYAVVLTPRPEPRTRLKPAQTSFTLTIYLDERDFFPVRSVLRTGDLTVQTLFREVQWNPELDPSVFRFIPPEGAEVYGDFRPPKF